MKSLWSLFRRKEKVESPLEKELSEEKLEMIQGIEELPTTIVKEVMVPRIDVSFINEDEAAIEILEQVKKTGHSRYPVYSDTIDNITGVFYTKDLLQFIGRSISEISIKSMTRKPYFVPETMKLDVLLREMKKKRIHLAIVVDEYGGTSGIVCFEDILEEIIGDIQDEFDNERPEIVMQSSTIFLCDARTSVDDINEHFDLNLPSDQFDTLGGFVFDLFGRIPNQKEAVIFEEVVFTIEELEGHKVKRIMITLPEPIKDSNE